MVVHAWLIALLLYPYPWSNSHWGPTRQQELVDLENIRQVCMPQMRAYAPNFTDVEMMGYSGRIQDLRMNSTQIEPNLLRAMSDDEIAATRRELREDSLLPRGPGTSQQGLSPRVIADVSDCAFKQRLCQVGRTKYCGGGGANPSAPPLRPNVAAKPAPSVTKLPKARPAKTLPWSPKALSTDGSKLDPKFAAERADMLASCAVPIQQFGAAYTLTNGAANLLVEAGNLNDDLMALSAEVFKNHVLVLEKKIADGGHGARDIAAARAGRCVFLRRIAQLEGSPLISGAVDGTLTPLSIGGVGPPSKGIDPHIIAGNGKSAMHCVSLETTGSGDSNLSAAVTGRRFVNHCDDEVEIEWCNTPECERESGNTWTVQPGRGWPVSSNGEVRWGACHGRDTASAVKFSQGLRFYCNAPAKK